MAYSEDTLVQQTTDEYLHKQLKWQCVYADNNEDYGPDRQVGLTRYLRQSFVELNQDLPDAADDDANRPIPTEPATASSKINRAADVGDDAAASRFSSISDPRRPVGKDTRPPHTARDRNVLYKRALYGYHGTKQPATRRIEKCQLI